MTQTSSSNSSNNLSQLGPIAQAVLTDDIFTAMGMADLPEEEKAELYRTMVATIQERVLARVLDALDEHNREQLLTLLDRPTGSEVEPFVRTHVPNIDEITTQETLLYKAEMVQNTRHIRSVLGVKETANTHNLPAVVGQPRVDVATRVEAGNELPVVVPPAMPPAVYHPDTPSKSEE